MNWDEVTDMYNKFSFSLLVNSQDLLKPDMVVKKLREAYTSYFCYFSILIVL